MPTSGEENAQISWKNSHKFKALKAQILPDSQERRNKEILEALKYTFQKNIKYQFSIENFLGANYVFLKELFSSILRLFSEILFEARSC